MRISIEEQQIVEYCKPIIWGWRERLPTDSTVLKGVRSCSSPAEVSAIDETKQVIEKLCSSSLSRNSSTALVGLISNVDEDETTVKFVCVLRDAITKGQKPAYSEVHFEELCASATLEIFHRRLKRAVVVLQRRVAVESMIECMVNWESEDSEECSDSSLKGALRPEFLKRFREEFNRELEGSV